MRRLTLLAALALAASACDTAAPGPVGTQVVVAGFLEADRGFPDIRITRTVPLGAVYDSTAVIPDATVYVMRLTAGGAPDGRLTYRYDGRGAYTPDESPTVEPGRTYRLVAVALGDTVTAETTVPAAITLVEPAPAEVVYQYNQTGPPLRITTSSTAGRQSVYIASVISLEADEFVPIEVGDETDYRSTNRPGAFRPVPIALLFNGCENDGAFLVCDSNPNTNGSSPIINESSYTRLGDGTAIVSAPWLAFGFYGPSRITLVALDDAFQDFIETQTLQTAPTTISPGEVPNVTTNVRGGLGVFGSFARVETTTTVLER